MGRPVVSTASAAPNQAAAKETQIGEGSAKEEGQEGYEKKCTDREDRFWFMVHVSGSITGAFESLFRVERVMVRAVCGFLFDETKSFVTLIKKNRPEWQAGKFNGVGGKVEEGEFAKEAMVREFEEETGVRLEDWEPFCECEDRMHNFHITYYRAFGDVTACRTTTDEEVEIIQVGAIFTYPVVPNLTWLVPMALDRNVSEAKFTWRDIEGENS